MFAFGAQQGLDGHLVFGAGGLLGLMVLVCKIGGDFLIISGRVSSIKY